mmetsp:Transcript_11498/g.29103  ORF Transcript_11498/g.29103 Transcript_11498/m.29103 type:complete len:283 (+) Transcript_11498:736-1584(+)
MPSKRHGNVRVPPALRRARLLKFSQPKHAEAKVARAAARLLQTSQVPLRARGSQPELALDVCKILDALVVCRILRPRSGCTRYVSRSSGGETASGDRVARTLAEPCSCAHQPRAEALLWGRRQCLHASAELFSRLLRVELLLLRTPAAQEYILHEQNAFSPLRILLKLRAPHAEERPHDGRLRASCGVPDEPPDVRLDVPAPLLSELPACDAKPALDRRLLRSRRHGEAAQCFCKHVRERDDVPESSPHLELHRTVLFRVARLGLRRPVQGERSRWHAFSCR